MAEPNREREQQFTGMTVNERLFAAGLPDSFDSAVRSGERKKMIDLLMNVGLEPEAAVRTADAILADPTRFGRLK
jgi:hypothetical protein